MSSDGNKRTYFLIAKEIGTSSGAGGTAKVLEALAALDLDEKEEESILIDAKSEGESSLDFVKILKIFRVVRKIRESVSQAYEEAMTRYSKVNSMTGKRRPTEDEAKLKQTLMDYILKIEGTFERNDLADESLIKELHKFFESLDSADKLSEENISSLYISPKTASLISPLLERMQECYEEYGKIRPILKRLIRIADYIIEDAGPNS
ncbi:hypothetical protein LEP1GSC058_2197 [Leptospira fainei serovar Hurstbridge str. BUT 6]|uniref:Uncharacterized protein n=1 Tax=Leptospira fainei serovar Hurstbridge str. BUT 6 TaxID=1193011 RepID=S3VGJ0_9LEPT|nr:hypothetical protein [Leptospira fainei]EPG75560.1 hypothetical protein LEP1GSC058_2197 [Leptospira fainei serovar Hurstbridge str. BUT 6]